MAFFKLNRKSLEVSKEEKIKRGQQELEKVIVSLSKDTGVDLGQLVARCAVVMDHSGSMQYQFEGGMVQEILDMLLPFAIQFDDDKKLQVFLFDNNCRKIDEDMDIVNYKNYVKEQIIKKRYSYGGTQYAPAIRKTDKYYDDHESKIVPTLIFFITDGDNFREDRKPSDNAIIESSDHGIFYMFIGVGNDDFNYLRHLDDLEGRKYDNTGFMKFSDFEHISSVNMFTNALKDYIPWLKAKGYIR